MENLSLKEFAAALSGKEPVPGGGGASALVGAVGTALGNMVGSLTVGKKKYADNLYTYTAKDLRFTTKGNTIYVIAMDWPGNSKTIRVKNLNNRETNSIKSVSFLASGEKVKWKQDENGLYITTPSHPTGEYAYTFKVCLK